MQVRTFSVKTQRSTGGVKYTYCAETGRFLGLVIYDVIDDRGFAYIKEQLKGDINDFITWCATTKGLTVVELNQVVTFDMFWKKYNDCTRSSRKRSEKLWNKLSKDEQVKAFYYIDTYERNRGDMKKYCETYLSAELWNN